MAVAVTDTKCQVYTHPLVLNHGYLFKETVRNQKAVECGLELL